MVLHHGEGGWSAPVSLRELYDAPAAVLDDLRPYIPELTFVLDDLAPQSDAALRARALSAIPRLVLWALKHVRRGRDVIPALRKARDLVRAVLLAPNGVASLLTVMRYIVEVADSSEQELISTLERTMLPDAREALMTLAERWRREGLREGIKKGIEKGRKENQRQVLLRLLSRRFGALPEPVVDRVRGAKLDQLDRWFDRGISALSLDAVFADET